MELTEIYDQLLIEQQALINLHARSRRRTEEAFYAMGRAQHEYLSNPTESGLADWNAKKTAFEAAAEIRLAEWKKLEKVQKALDKAFKMRLSEIRRNATTQNA